MIGSAGMERTCSMKRARCQAICGSVGRKSATAGAHRLRLAEPVDLHDPRHDRAARADCQITAPARPAITASSPSAISRQFFACTRAEPMRSSQAWAAL